MTTKKAIGSCLCGKVKIEAGAMDTGLGACHCSMCRTWSAGPFLSVNCGSDVKIHGEEYLGVYDSSEWAARAFCKNCGTSLFYKLKGDNLHFVSSEIFKDKDFKFDHQVFIDEKPSYYDFSNATKNMTGEEVFAAFAPQN